MEMADCLHAARVLAFGSTGIFSKSDSSSPIEQDFVNQQIESEHRFAINSQKNGLAWTLFRPTMIYGAGSDLNVAFIGKFIRRFKFFLVPRGANGLRQPVHADDLAGACLAVLACEHAFGRAYNLGGGEWLVYADLVARIFIGLKMRPQIVAIPFFVYKWLIRIIRIIPRFGFISPDMVDRMRVDLVADHTDAQRDFGYKPRLFFPTAVDIFGTHAH
jgi:nucleoside-diphosphate-sugar epimerase